MPKFVSGRELIAAVAGPKGDFDTRQSWIARAARRVGISYRQARAIFYGEIQDPYHASVRRLHDAAAVKGRAEAAHLAQHYYSLASALRVSDPDFHRADIAACLDAARALQRIHLAQQPDIGDDDDLPALLKPRRSDCP